jgi:hypothetical protein
MEQSYVLIYAAEPIRKPENAEFDSKTLYK